MWLRVLDTSQMFSTQAVNAIPIEFITRPDKAVEVSGGDLWAYNGSLYQRAGFNEGAHRSFDRSIPGWTSFPNGTVFDFWK